MTGVWAIDTGVSRNGCALARVERSRGGIWDARVWSWQGSTGAPLRIEAVVGPEVARLLGVDGASLLHADGYEVQQLRRGVGDSIQVKVKGGDLVKEYGPAKRLAEAADPRLYVHPVGHVWTPRGWEDDPRAGERVADGIKAVERRMVGGKLVVSLPEFGNSHHDEAVAVMRALAAAGADREAVPANASSFGATPYVQRADWYPTPGY